MYAVNYENRVESNTIKEFQTLGEAKTYADDFFKGYEPFDGDDDDRRSWCKCEVYEVGDNGPEMVYETGMFWER